MDRPTLWGFAAALFALGVPAAAQTDEEGAEEGAVEVEDETAPVEAVPAPAKKGQIRGLEEAPDTTHTVVKGDTLWDLSARYLQTPWYWPKVWSYNPKISNPHWIYPGQAVRFYRSADQGPTLIGPEPTTTEPTGPEEVGPVAAPTEIDDVTKATFGAPELFGQPSDTVTLSSVIGYVPLKSSILRRDGFVTQAELDESGVIERSYAENEFLSTLDRVYLKFRTRPTQVGERFIVYRTIARVVHPRTGEHYGYLTHVLGSLRVARLDETMTTGVIDRAFDEMHRGDYVAPFTTKFERPLQRKPNTKELTGFVVASFVPSIGELGEYHIVFVDRGSRDGIEEGNTFHIVRRADGLQHIMSRAEDPSVPQEDIGLVMVVDVKPGASACLVLKSVREIQVGDRLEMRLPGARTAQAP